MADITNSEAIRFCNERCRRLADFLGNVYYMAKSIENEWYANDLGTLFPTGEGPVLDGSAIDGRHPVMADDILLLITRCSELVADYEAGSNAKLNTILSVAVNTHRFEL